MKPSNQQWQALVNLTNSPEWKHLKEILSSHLMEAQQSLEGVNNLEGLFRAQGRASLARELIKTFEESREMLERIQASTSRPTQ